MSPRILLVGLIALPLCACGKMGELERPGPLFGHAPAASASTTATTTDPNASVTTVDPREEMSPVPQRTDPIPGTKGPGASARPPGALPDPYNNPQ